MGGGGSSDADSNVAEGPYSAVGGGRRNYARGEHAAIPGGKDNVALDMGAFAAGWAATQQAGAAERNTMVRPAYCAGSWYPGNPVEMNRVLDEYLSEAPVEPGAAHGVIAPHAGWVYSGRVAGAVYGCVNVPATAIVMCPNHTGLGSQRAIAGKQLQIRTIGNNSHTDNRKCF